MLAGASGACSDSVPDSDAAEPELAASTPSARAGFGDPVKCAECHPNHALEWSMSPHAYALRDPVFRAMLRLGQSETKGKLEDFCVRCHSPIASETGQAQVRFDEDSGQYVQDLDAVDEIAGHGVSCDGCHSVDEVTATANALMTLHPRGPRRATIDSPVSTPAHETQFSELHASSRFCGACHQVVSRLFTEPIALERTFAEWVQSSFNGAKDCQDCHMPEYEGRAATSGPMRTVHHHYFEGVDVSLLPPRDFPGYDRLRERSQALLESSLELGISYKDGALEVALHNLAGHALPSGATADRELWVELRVDDADGRSVLESGTLDARGDLRDGRGDSDAALDAQLVVFRQIMRFDPKLEAPASREPVRDVHFLWEPNSEESHLILAAQTLRPRYTLPELPAGRYRARVRVLMRAFPPRLLRELEARAGLDPEVKQRMPTVEMANAALNFELP